MSRQASPGPATGPIMLRGADRLDTAEQARACGQALPGEIFLRDGTPALIWPLLPTDAETHRDMFRRLSPDSRRHRFLEALGQLDDTMIRLLVDSVDGVSRPRRAVDWAVGLWALAAQALADQASLLFRLPQESLIQAVDGNLELVARATEVNRDLTVRWIQAASVPCRADSQQIPHRGGR